MCTDTLIFKSKVVLNIKFWIAVPSRGGRRWGIPEGHTAAEY